MTKLAILTTVGTSILTNFIDEDKNPSLRTNERASFRNQIKALERNRKGKHRKYDKTDWRILLEDWEDEDDYDTDSSLKSNILKRQFQTIP